MNTIEVVKGGNHDGKLRVSIATSPFSSRNIIVDVRDVHSVASLHNDDIGEDDIDGNILSVKTYVDE